MTGISGIGAMLPLTGTTGTTATAPVSTDTTAAQAGQGVQGPTGPQFGQLLANGIQGLEAMNDKTDTLAVKAATGDLGAIHDYTIAASEASVATQLTVAVRNKAVEAFNEIMRMQVG
ncbi:MAG: flagellar hook-basal body complex protein FliE [Nocardioidaceae bacterium]|jgi:flagellar hook-basal body complex protein FliE|nr:flagellar hook-basal body complex protein FliE [Nocardioidaceae bacterium]